MSGFWQTVLSYSPYAIKTPKADSRLTSHEVLDMDLTAPVEAQSPTRQTEASRARLDNIDLAGMITRQEPTGDLSSTGPVQSASNDNRVEQSHTESYVQNPNLQTRGAAPTRLNSRRSGLNDNSRVRQENNLESRVQNETTSNRGNLPRLDPQNRPEVSNREPSRNLQSTRSNNIAPPVTNTTVPNDLPVQNSSEPQTRQTQSHGNQHIHSRLNSVHTPADTFLEPAAGVRNDLYRTRYEGTRRDYAATSNYHYIDQRDDFCLYENNEHEINNGHTQAYYRSTRTASLPPRVGRGSAANRGEYASHQGNFPAQNRNPVNYRAYEPEYEQDNMYRSRNRSERYPNRNDYGPPRDQVRNVPPQEFGNYEESGMYHDPPHNPVAQGDHRIERENCDGSRDQQPVYSSSESDASSASDRGRRVDRYGYRGRHRAPSRRKVNRSRSRESVPKYNGKFEFDNFRLQFECMADDHEWTYAQKGKKLNRCLVDEARNVLGTLCNKEVTDYNKLCAALDSLHSNPGGKALVQAQLQQILRPVTQNAQVFGREIKRLGKKAYPAGNEEALVASFIRGLNDEELRKHVQKQMPESLDAAIKEACIHQAVEGTPHSGKKPQVVAQVTETAQSSIEPRIAELETKLDLLLKKMDTVNKRPKVPLAEVRCHRCKQLGHYADKCPQGGYKPDGPEYQRYPAARLVTEEELAKYPELLNSLNH